jgi:hypothetical protein
MATRNQVLSMFGASPEQIMERQRQEQARAIQQIRDPYQQTGTAIGMALGNMFGGESAEVARQRELYSMLGQVNLDSPESMRMAASTLKDRFPDRALQLLSMADQLQTNVQSRATSKAQEEKANIVSVPRLVGYSDVYGKNDMGETIIVGQKPVYQNVPIPRSDIQAYNERQGKYQEWFDPTQPPTGDNTVEVKPIPENAVRLPETKNGTNVVLVGDDFYIATDEGNLGRKITREEFIKDLGGALPEEEEGPGVLDRLGNLFKGRNSQTPSTETQTPVASAPASDAEQRRRERVANKREDIIPDWLKGRNVQ